MITIQVMIPIEIMIVREWNPLYVCLMPYYCGKFNFWCIFNFSFNSTSHITYVRTISCPALNLSLELSPSRVITHDAVLPSALINTISNEYLGDNPKTDPLASPVYAHDSILSIFPPTLMYVSSQDPFLDDAVVFNKRLKRLGVECDLRAAQNLPHGKYKNNRMD